jgi:hypothetical protein
MEKQRDSCCKERGWNGICLRIPENWETGKIARQYLLFEKNACPVMDIRWEKVKGKFSIQKQFLALKKKGCIRECPMPEAWKEGLAVFRSQNGPCESLPFQWQGDRRKDRGMLFFLPDTRQLILLRFFCEKSERTENISSSILATLRSVPRNKPYLWALFDIRFLLSADWQLGQYGFSPGEFRLFFTKKSQSLHFFRWGPADFLLRRGGLPEFIRSRFCISPEKLFSADIQGYKGMGWQQQRKKKGIYLFFSKKYDTEQGFLWHIPAANRIMGIKSRNMPPGDGGMEEICNNYMIIPVKN